MKNKFLFIIVILLYNSVLSQTRHAVYGIRYGNYVKKTYNFNNANSSNLNKVALSLLKGLNKENEGIQFDLFFNKKESIFKLQNKLHVNESSLTTVAVSGTKGVFYNNFKERLRQVNSYGNLFIIKYHMLDNKKWKLLDENKKIGEYNCYKALTSYSIDGEKFNVEAWFTPEITARFGPKGFNNLPGLIIELTIINRTKVTFYLKTLELVTSNIKIQKPKKGKLVTKEEYDNIGKNLMRKMRNEN